MLQAFCLDSDATAVTRKSAVWRVNFKWPYTKWSVRQFWTCLLHHCLSRRGKCALTIRAPVCDCVREVLPAAMYVYYKCSCCVATAASTTLRFVGLHNFTYSVTEAMRLNKICRNARFLVCNPCIHKLNSTELANFIVWWRSCLCILVYYMYSHTHTFWIFAYREESVWAPAVVSKLSHCVCHTIFWFHQL